MELSIIEIIPNIELFSDTDHFVAPSKVRARVAEEWQRAAARHDVSARLIVCSLISLSVSFFLCVWGGKNATNSRLNATCLLLGLFMNIDSAILRNCPNKIQEVFEEEKSQGGLCVRDREKE